MRLCVQFLLKREVYLVSNSMIRTVALSLQIHAHILVKTHAHPWSLFFEEHHCHVVIHTLYR